MPVNRMRVATWLFAASLLACVVLPVECRSQVAQLTDTRKELKALPVEAALRARSFPTYSSVVLSPDGKWVAYTLQEPWKRETSKGETYKARLPSGTISYLVGSSVWVANTQSGKAKNLTDGLGTSWGPGWSPDGRYLAFYSDRSDRPNLWIWETSSGKLKRVADVVVLSTDEDEAQWCLDGGHVVLKALPEGMTVDDELKLMEPFDGTAATIRSDSKVTVTVHASPASESSVVLKKPENISQPGEEYDLTVIDVGSGTSKRVLKRRSFHSYTVSPDGRYVALTNPVGTAARNSQQRLFDVLVVSLKTGETRTIASGVPSLFRFFISWSPDSQHLAYLNYQPMGRGSCFVAPADGSRPARNLTADRQLIFSGPWLVPVWDAHGAAIYFPTTSAIWRANPSKNEATEITKLSAGNRFLMIISSRRKGRFLSFDGGKSIVAAVRHEETMQNAFLQIELSSGAPVELLTESKDYKTGSTPGFDFSADGSKVVYLAEDSQNCADIWIGENRFNNRRRLTHSNPELENYAFGQSRVIEWRGSDGQSLKGALLLPSHYQSGTRYPLIVRVYGGSLRSNRLNRFGLDGDGVDNMQLFATRGYAVLLPDTPLRTGTPMQDLAKTVLPGVEKVVDLGIADPQRLGVMGHSYGGYSTLALIVQSTRFKAAVASASTSNLLTSYGRSLSDFGVQWSEEGQGRMGGSPWQYRERYIDNSPFFYFNKVETPVLLLHGGADTLTWPSFAVETFVALRRLGKEVVYAKYDGEPHSPTMWGYANQVDYCKRIIVWFDKYLKAPEKAQSIKQ